MFMSVNSQTFEEYLEKYAKQNKISVDEARKHKVPIFVKKLYEEDRKEAGKMP